ncbi:dUTP diphosphatase [Anaerococcus degeneri]|uniref:dUTP diphosphatase n=1 Tax=Anaerococcus degeneri TaxID=361500 RepID=A0ABS7Z3A6_9FIRM|nr:dUTP diphosphatase [Anaerococcus degeneri]MBP2015033.1 dUTP pyrophosphatase [Anaerococcus degeneri]MCA2097241.1 dUTP diphosphatase [Anaerococcus degeneri]
MKENILKIKTEGQIPAYATEYSAGIDLYCKSDEDIIIKAKETVKIHTGVYVEIPEGYFGAVYPRSSTGVKKHLMLANTVGIIDSDYRGELMIFFYNYGEEEQIIENGDRLAQLVIQPYMQCEIQKVDDLADSERGEGGFGSTGK